MDFSSLYLKILRKSAIGLILVFVLFSCTNSKKATIYYDAEISQIEFAESDAEQIEEPGEQAFHIQSYKKKGTTFRLVGGDENGTRHGRLHLSEELGFNGLNPLYKPGSLLMKEYINLQNIGEE